MGVFSTYKLHTDVTSKVNLIQNLGSYQSLNLANFQKLLERLLGKFPSIFLNEHMKVRPMLILLTVLLSSLIIGEEGISLVIVSWTANRWVPGSIPAISPNELLDT